MIASLAIAVLLGTSVVFGEKPSWAEIQRRVLNSLQMNMTISVQNPDGKVVLGTVQFRLGDSCPIEHSNFNTGMIIKRIEEGDVYSDIKFDVANPLFCLPTITVEGKHYRLHALRIQQVDHEAAYLRAVFIENCHTTNKTSVSIFVPVILSEDSNDHDRNIPLTNELLLMKTLTPTNEDWAKITWLKNLLGNAKRLVGYNGAYMTDCQTIWSGFFM